MKVRGRIFCLLQPKAEEKDMRESRYSIDLMSGKCNVKYRTEWNSMFLNINHIFVLTVISLACNHAGVSGIDFNNNERHEYIHVHVRMYCIYIPVLFEVNNK